jgi:hypothetical protein
MGIPTLFEVRDGISFGGAHMISGDGAPGGVAGRPDDAIKGSLYLDETNGQMYLKKLTGTGSDKWVRVQSQDDLDNAILGQSWREPALLRDITNYADLSAAETVINTLPYEIDGVVVDDSYRILFDNITGEANNVFIVNGTPGSGATLVEDNNTESKGDALYIQDGTDAGKQFAYNGTDWVQQGSASQTELGFIHTFMGKSGNGNETPDYASTNVITDGDSLEKGVSDLDAEVGGAIATPQSRTAGPISDQAINLNVEAIDDAIGADVTSTNQVTAADSINENITALDSAIGDDVVGAETRTVGAISVQDTNSNIEALDDAVGADVTSTKIVTAANSVNANISALDVVLGDTKTESKTDSVTTSTTLDSVLVDGILAVEWLVHARSTVSNANIWAGKVLAIHNGTASGDASDVDYNSFAILKTGSAIPALDFEVVLSGTGVSQEMQLKASSSQAVNIRISRSLLNEQ